MSPRWTAFIKMATTKACKLNHDRSFLSKVYNFEFISNTVLIFFSDWNWNWNFWYIWTVIIFPAIFGPRIWEGKLAQTDHRRCVRVFRLTGICYKCIEVCAFLRNFNRFSIITIELWNLFPIRLKSYPNSSGWGYVLYFNRNSSTHLNSKRSQFVYFINWWRSLERFL